MKQSTPTSYIAFDGSRRIAFGDLMEVASKTKELLDKEGQASVLIFDDATGEQVDLDFRGTRADVLSRLEEAASRGGPVATMDKVDQESPRGPGRPKLGVVAREVTLLPRHWDWLNGQPGGASVALRKLVEEARRVNEGRDRVRRSQEAAYRFMSTMAGNLPGFEEATRAFFAGNPERFDAETTAWPEDVRDHLKRLAAPAFEGVDGSS